MIIYQLTKIAKIIKITKIQKINDEKCILKKILIYKNK